MATATHTITINAAFLQEIKEDHQDLHNLLQAGLKMLAVPWAHIPPKPLVELLGELRDQLALHFALEEAFGYFDDAIEAEPRLSRRAESLRSEHRELFVELCALEEQAEQLLYHETGWRVVRRIALRYHVFCEHLADHESRENDLILQAFAEDIGEGD